MSTNLWAEDRVLESINVIEKKGYSIVDIRLNQQLIVSSYSPLNGGDRLRIKVRRAGSALQITEEPVDFETLTWKPSRKVPLYQVTVDLTDGSVLLEFKQPVKYKVRGGNDTFHLLVEVFHSIEQPIKQAEPVIPSVDDEIKQATVQDPILAQVMDAGRAAMLDKNYSKAVENYTKVVLEGSQTTYAREALEYLGLARERQGQLEHAKVAYTKYLKLYPEGGDTDRVKQRLSGILTARAEPKEKLRKEKQVPEKTSGLDWSTYGSVSQFYSRDVSKVNNDASRLNRSSLQDNLDITSRLRTEDYQLTGRFSGAYEDHLETSDQDEHRISSFYVDFHHKPLDSTLRIGRQSRSTGGVLGRFDGLLVSFPVMDSVQLNLVAGYSIESSRDVFINNDTYFYGISADLGTYFNAWSFNTFFIEQINEGVLDRRAMGGEIRYFQPNRSFFSFLDYDIYHNELNTFLFTGQYVFPDRTTITATYDHRKSPLLTTRNALQNLTGVDNLDDLLDFFSEDEIKQLAKDRTATTQTFNLGLSRPLTENFQVNADFRWNHTSGTNTSVGIPVNLAPTGRIDGRRPSGDNYSYSIDFTANSLLTRGDLYTIGFRYNDSKSNTTTFSINTRFPVTREFRVNPRFRFDLRDNVNGTTRWTYRPSIRLNYRIFKSLQLEAEAGGEWQKSELPSNVPEDFDRVKGYFFIVGYRLDF